MAIYHATTKPISRSSGRSATASAAYRAGVEIMDERTGLTHDYSKRDGVAMTFTFKVDSDGKTERLDRNELWNKAELAENRKDARTAREWIVAIPNELLPDDVADQKGLKNNDGAKAVVAFAKELSKRYGVAIDLAIHSPDKEGDNRNWHAHIMTTTRQVSLSANGDIELGDKATIELSNTKRKTLGLGSTSAEIKELRELWAMAANKYLKHQGHDERLDHRSYAERGIEQLPTQKLGWKASAMERRGIETDRGNINRAIHADNLKIKGLALEIRVGKSKLEEQKQALEFQQGMDALRAKQEAIKAAKAPQTEPSIAQQIDHKRQILQRFDKGITEKAEEILNHELKTLRDKAKPLLKELNQIRDNKPLNPFKIKAWQQELDKNLEQYSKIKSAHDTKKQKGVTPEHKEIARTLYHQAFPDKYNRLYEIQQEVKAFDQHQAQQELQQRQAELAQRRQERQAQRADRGKDKDIDY